MATRCFICGWKIHNTTLGIVIAHKLRHGPNSSLISGTELSSSFLSYDRYRGDWKKSLSKERGKSRYRGNQGVSPFQQPPPHLSGCRLPKRRKKKFNTAAHTRLGRDKTTPKFTVHSEQCNLTDIQ